MSYAHGLLDVQLSVPEYGFSDNLHDDKLCITLLHGSARLGFVVIYA